jgi:hypothetical protein
MKNQPTQFGSACSLFVLFGALALPVTANALEWKVTERAVRAAPFEPDLDLVYEFRNDSAKPVTITSIQTNCHCISAKADKSVYQPGESGQVTAHFVVADRYGFYERTISVASDDVPAAQHLIARIEVPDLAVITPRSLEWNVGAAPEEQAVEIRAAGDLHIEFTEATSTSLNFTVRLEPVEIGRVYRLHMKPVSTAANANAAVRVWGHDNAGHKVLVSAYANVR